MNAAERLLGEGALARHGARVALICEDEDVTYAELARRTGCSSAAFAAFGVKPGERVLLMLRDTPEFAAAWLGAVRAGVVVIAVNSKLPADDMRHIARDSGARLALVEDSFAAEGGVLAKELRVVGSAEWREALQQAREVPAAGASEETPAFMLYSSGTTGRPKGIVHAHRTLSSVGQSFRAFGIGEGDRVFTSSKFFFAYGIDHGLLSPLATGATSILFADAPDPQSVLRLVERHRPSAMFSVPTFYRRLLSDATQQLRTFSPIRRFVAAGERLSAALLAQWKTAVGAEILNLYGMSETFCACMVTAPGTSDGLRTGMPLPGVEVRLVDGVLWVKHPAQAGGYANLPQQTREQFQDGWFCSRDLFVRDAEGHYVHQGRADELLKVAGQWVNPGELEEAVGREPAIAEAACVRVNDADGLERLALFVTPRADAAAAQEAAAAACESLPRHKRPKWVRAVTELPRTATGKVQRFKLREILEREISGKH